MSTIYIGGVGKADVKRLLEQRRDPKLKIVVSNDLEAGPILKRTSDTYYIGRCHTFGRQARVNTADVQKLLDTGIRVFGLSVDQINTVVPALVDAIQARRPEGGTA